VRDNSELPPSVLIGQLRDYLATGWRLADEAPDNTESRKRLLDAITTVHPLQAFSPRYFQNDPASPLFTYASEWAHARHARPPAQTTPLPIWQTEPVLDIGTLQRFLARPATCFYSERLKVRFEDIDTSLDDDEPFALSGLENHSARQALLLSALTSDDAEPTLADAAESLRQQGVVPSGGFGALTVENIGDDVQRILHRWHASIAHWSEEVPAMELRHAHGEHTVEGWLDDLRTDSDGMFVRLLPMAGNLCQDNAIRYETLLQPWVLQLLANANHVAMSTRFLGPDATVVLKPLDPALAAELLNALLDAWKHGMQTPLPIARRTAYAWLQVERNEKSKRDPADVAEKCYEGSDAYSPQPGEMHREPCLARTWKRFSHLHADGFERWLSLYRPLLDAAELEGEA
jgi:exodeoxyribonuclease V gamma subunit